MLDDFNLGRSFLEDYRPKACNAWVATAIVGSAVVGAGATIWGANKAAEAQKDASQRAADTSLNMYNTTRGDLAPFRQIGIDANAELQKRLPFLTSPIDVTQELGNPNSIARKAYDFQNVQGLKAVQNSAAARGLGTSGAALKGAAIFNQGLTNQTYPQLFNMENTNRTNAYTRLKSLIDTGQSAAAQTGTAGTVAANKAADAQIGGGNAAAAGYNATGGAIAGAANNIGGYMAYRGLYGNNNNSEESSSPFYG